MFYFAGTQKAGAEQIRGRQKLGWTPLHLVCSIASGVEGDSNPPGWNAEGLISTAYAKDPFDPAWADNADVKGFLDWEKANLTQGNPRDSGVVVGYIASFLAAHVLEKAGSTLTRKTCSTSPHIEQPPRPDAASWHHGHDEPTDYSVINRFQIQHFESGRWVPVGKTISGE